MRVLPVLLAFVTTSVLAGAKGAQDAPRVVFLYGEDEYGSYETVPAFAAELESKLGLDCVLLPSRDRRLPDLAALEDADLLVLFLRFREANDAEIAPLDAWLASGKPALALRTTSHAFQGRKAWFPPLFGGHYKGHASNAEGTRAVAAVSAALHPILRGVPRVIEAGHGGTYNAQPLSEGAEVLLFGRTGELPAEPIAWTFGTTPGQRLVYTSLGTEQNFENADVRRFLANAVLWGLGARVPAGGAFDGTPHPPLRGALPEILEPPALDAPPDATVLFDGTSLARWRHWDPSVAPLAIGIDERADTTSGSPEYDAARWPTEGRAVVARPGFGDIVTRESFGDVHVHLDFFVPREPAWVPDDFRGASGVYLAGRYEIVLLDSWQKDTTDATAGALFGQVSPASNASRPAGAWQSLDVTYSHRAGEPPRISAWLNDVPVLSNVRPEEATTYGFLRPVPGSVLAGEGAEARHVANAGTSLACDWGARSFALAAEFRTESGGTLASKCPPEGAWAPDAKALFLRGGRLVYDIGWVGALTSQRRWNDGDWHRVVLTSDGGVARLWVDGDLEAEREDFAAQDDDEFVFKIGAANFDFAGVYEGDLGGIAFYDRELSQAQARALSAGEVLELEPAYDWSPEDELGEASALDPEPAPRADGVLVGPLRLQADASAVRFANIWVRPLGEVDHAGLIASLDDAAYQRGEAIYQGLCVACHGADGTKPTNPKARPFALGVLENGSSMHELFATVSDGFRDMPGNAWLRPDQRYDVIHYVREHFLRERNPSQYSGVSDAYLNALPKGLVGRPEESVDELPRRDYGPALASQLGDDVGACLTVRLDDDAAIAYDLQQMSSPGAWAGGFLDLGQTQHYQQRGEGRARPGGELLDGLEGWAWGFGGALDWDRGRRAPRGPVPREWLDYHGHFVHAGKLVLSYAIDGREVLELPGIDRTSGMPVITHRLSIAAGDAPLVLRTAAEPSAGGRISFGLPDDEAPEPWRVAVQGRVGAGGNAITASAVAGSGEFSIDDDAVVRIPASDEATELWILCFAAQDSAALDGFHVLLENLSERPFPASPKELCQGGPARWPEELVTRGALGEAAGAYVLDTLTLPAENPWGAWLRTSAIDFFDDGRAAVSTYGGDVWIVSGIDAGLAELRWRRFAAGMFEPMGVRVVDGLVYVTCRDRITRLHDLNGDGEADFYESFFADPDVSPNFHAFNFDLQTDDEGAFYYAKSGQYTDFDLGGAILRVDPDGGSYEVYATGLRTPNGMGMSPDGRPLVSDNQGNWIPASKVSLAKPGGFYGVFPAIDTNTPGEKTREDFDPPVIWMPQRLDSSSGGQLWVDDERFGPLAGRYLHTSFGKGWMYVLSVEDLGAVAQGATYRLPFQFAAGIQRLRVNPADGQVYTVGLSGWQGPAGGADGCLQRVRYTGASEPLLLDVVARARGVALHFSEPLDPEAAADLERFSAKRWNYRWARSYGSAHYSLTRPQEEGEDPVRVVGTRLSADGKTLRVDLEDMRPVHQLVLELELDGADGSKVEVELFLTVNEIPEGE